MLFVDANGIKLATESFGAPGNPPLILIMGATASMLGWPDAFCAELARLGLFVVRFDHRDTGASTTVPPGTASYTVEDMAGDVVSIMNAYGFHRASLMGMSLGGYIAQMVTLVHPERIVALVLMSAEPLGWVGPPLPNVSSAVMAHFGRLSDLNWDDEAAVTEFLIRLERLCAASETPFSETDAKLQISRILRRTRSPASMFNHAGLNVREVWDDRFREISCPVLVIHGTDDQILPVENGAALAEGIPDAVFLRLHGMGHELPDRIIPEVADAVALHVLGK